MPRDLIETETKPDLSKPSLKGLAWLLRHPWNWPVNFEWDYMTVGNEIVSAAQREVEHAPLPEVPCGSAGCAVGVARLVWGLDACSDAGIELGDESLNDWKTQIFNTHAITPVTPSVVAGRIDDYLAGRPIRYLVAGDRRPRSPASTTNALAVAPSGTGSQRTACARFAKRSVSPPRS